MGRKLEQGSLAFSDEDKLALESVVELEWNHGPLSNLALVSNLRSLTFGYYFDQSLANAILPVGLQRLTFGDYFNQSLDGATLPSGLRSLTFGESFNQSLANILLPS